jgi:hypothetical protein
MTKLIVAFRNFANAPKKRKAICQHFRELRTKVTQLLGHYKRTLGKDATHIGPMHMIGREMKLMWHRLVYYTGSRVSEKIEKSSTVNLETAGPSQKLTPIH